MCGSVDHLHESTTRYDAEQGVLTFLLVCHPCQYEQVVLAEPYRPDFDPHGNDEFLPT